MSHRLIQTFHVLVLALLHIIVHAEDNPRRCVVETWHDRKTTGGDADLSLNVIGIEDQYEPGFVYTVTLQTVEEDKVFRYWWLWARAESPAEAKAMGGFLTPADDQEDVDVACFNTLVNAEGTSPNMIKGVWTAPARGCVRVGGAVSVVESGEPEATFVSRLVCSREVSVVPPHAAQCCACDEAKYEMTFEGLWSRNTHPKDFPADESVTKFGDVIGASHSTQYRFWEFGRPASEGLREVAEEGGTIILEKELKDQSENIRTIIKARGIKYPNMNGKTFAVFRADNQHHLISLVSQLSPSPDWLVGVSGLDLCLRNCSWEQARVIDLYPFDAGTDSGVSYLSPNESTSPPEPVHPLRPGRGVVTDPRSPFYESSGTDDTLKPLARLYLTRQRIYEKSCDMRPTTITEKANSRTQTQSGPCDVLPWGRWSACSVTCGTGVKLRQRSYVEPTRADAFACRVELTQRQRCRGFRQHCRLSSHYDADTASSVGPCAVTAWGRWGACSASCGRGVRVRERTYRAHAPDIHKTCHLGYRERPRMQQTAPCYEKHINCTQETVTWQQNSSSPDCALTPWAAWSRCDTGCRPSRRMRTRILLTSRAEQESMLAVLDKEWQRLYNALRVGNHSAEFQLYLPEGETEDKALSSARIHLQRCSHEAVTQTTWCPRDENCDSNAKRARDVCSLDYDVGHCRMYSERWFFDALRLSCEPFGYGGCEGNMNNFATYRECRQVCDPYRDELIRNRDPHSNRTDTPAAADISSDIATNLKKSTGQGCIISEWTKWSACSETCGFSALRSRARTVSPPQVTQHDGTEPRVHVKCPSRLQVQICSRLPPCPSAGT